MNTITYTLNPTSLVVRAYESEKVARSMGNGVAFFTNADELLENVNVTSKLLVDAYNEIVEKPVKKFSDSKTAAKRFMSAIADIHVSSTPFDATKKTPSVDEILTKELESVDLVKTKKVFKPRGAFAGKMIKALVTENPRKVNTKEVCMVLICLMSITLSQVVV